MISRNTLLQKLTLFAKDWHRTGSSYICDPPVMDTDEDYIVLSKGNLADLVIRLQGIGFNMEQQYYGGHTWFVSLRLGIFNLVITESSLFYNRFVAATLLARWRNIRDKGRRIAFFQTILYENNADSFYLRTKAANLLLADRGLDPLSYAGASLKDEIIYADVEYVPKPVYDPLDEGELPQVNVAAPPYKAKIKQIKDNLGKIMHADHHDSEIELKPLI